MRRADRLLRLVQLLRSRRTATAAELAAELGVSVRTIYRAVRDLEDAGVPVEGEAGVGYRLSHRMDLPAMTFSVPELEALVLGVRMVQAWGDPALAGAARSALDRVRGVLPGPLRRSIDDTVLFATRVPWTPEAGVGLRVLREAIGTRQRVLLVYKDARGQESQRTVWPLALYFWGDRWTVGGWCELREDFRNFRPDRVVSAEALDSRFEPSEGRDLEAFRAAMHAQGMPGSDPPR
jgi:predicted DNA-binding transcriptional regulator YafY